MLPDMNLSDDVPPPPYSERDVHSHQGHSFDDNGRPSGSIGHPPPLPSSSSARTYFESRPLPPGFHHDLHITHTINVSTTSRPDQFPYSPDFAAHDVTPHDWQTFLNFLLPNHATTSNEAIIDRKLAAEEQNSAAPSSLAPTTAGSSSSSSGRSPATVHLEGLRRESAEVHAEIPIAKQEAEAVVSEWNHGFFQPRAIWVRLVFQPPLESRRGHDTDIRDRNQPQTLYHPPPGPPPLMMPQALHPPMVYHAQPYGPPWHKGQSDNGFSFAGITIKDDGFSIGNSVVADKNGIRVGGLVADAHGLRYRHNVIAGRGMFGGGPNPAYPGTMYRQSAPPGTYHPPLAAPGGLPRGGPAFPVPADSNPVPTQYLDAQRRPLGPRGLPESQRQCPPRRHTSFASSSASSSSSDSDDSDSSSDTTVDSLPDLDDLEPWQLPAYRYRLRTWLAEPQNRVTNEEVRRLTAELQEAKRRKAEFVAEGLDKKVLRAEVKGLVSEWKARKRAQRSVRKAEKKARKKVEKKERKERKERERELKKAMKRRAREGGRPQWGSSSVPPPGTGMGTAGPGFPHQRSHGPWGGYYPSASCGVEPSRGPEGVRPEQRHFSPSGSWPAEEWQGQEPTGAQKGGQIRGVQAYSHAPGEAMSYPRSQVKFRMLDELEKELAKKYTQLDEARVWDEELKNRTEGEKRPETTAVEVPSVTGKTVGDGRPTAEIGSSARRLEAEVEELKRSVDRLRIEADEEFARELEEQERREASRSRSR